MEENTKIWNKKMDDLTVKDSVLLSLAMPIIVIGGAALVGTAAGVSSVVLNKFRSRNTQTETD